MWRVLLVLLVLCTGVHSEESSPRESELKTNASHSKELHGTSAQQITAPANGGAPTIINIFTAKHAGEEDQCTESKDWKGWAAFAWCETEEWLDAERVIAGFTVILGVATWFLWRATVRLVRSADKTAERQLRAYVLVKDMKMEEFKGATTTGGYGPIPGPTQHYRIEAVLENGGQTPTRLGIVNVNWKIDDALPDNFDFPDGPLTEKAHIGPGCTFSTPGFFISVEDTASVVLGTKRAFVWGWINYNDAFSHTPRHRTEFCFEIVPDQVPHDKKQMLRFSPRGPFNGADDDCLHQPKPYAEPT
jgi:hypothetical protein